MKKKIIFIGIVGCLICFFMFCKGKVYHVQIPTYQQHQEGYPKGCEGVSLYMALKGKGYVEDISLHEFMQTMPYSKDNPEYGFVGDPRLDSKAKINIGKRTTIYPSALASWGKQYGNVEDISQYTTNQLQEEIKKGNPIVVYMTSGFKQPQYKEYTWGNAVENNHALCLVGFAAKTKEYKVNDCGKNFGEYWVKQETFEKIYNARKFAVVIR